MRTLAHFVRNGGYSDSDMISFGWWFTVFVPGIFAVLGLLMIAMWGLVLITEMLVGESNLVLVYYFVSIPLFGSAVGIVVLTIGVIRQRASGREDR